MVQDGKEPATTVAVAASPTGRICPVCNEPATKRCSGCSAMYYCSVDHQKQDWKNHKNVCHPFKICSDERFGRYLVATKDIKAGEVVLKESPLVQGPAQITAPVCVGCLQGLVEKKFLECERCGWPVCRRECQDRPGHQAECKFTIARGSKVSDWVGLSRVVDSGFRHVCV